MHQFHDNTAGVVSGPGTADFTNFTDDGQFDSFTDLPNGEYSYIAKPASNKDGWELGEGVWNGTTLTRRTVYTSSNNGNKVSFGGKVIVYITATSDMLQRFGYDPFEYKADDEPIFILVTGQSNALQIWPSRTTMAYNPNVWDWSTDGVPLAGTGTTVENPPSSGTYEWDTPPAQDTAKFQFRQLDTQDDPTYVAWPTSTSPITFGDFPLGTNAGAPIYTGHTRGGAGGVAWGLADALQRATGRDVYMVCTAKSGEVISAWESGGAVRTELKTRADEALAALQVDFPGITAFDVVVWTQGASDALTTPPVEYANSWIDFRDYIESEGAYSSSGGADLGDSLKTRWFICDINQNNANFTSWEGLRTAQQKSRERTVLVSSKNKEIFPDPFNVHYFGDEHNKFGEEICRSLVFGPQPTVTPSPPFVPHDPYIDIRYTTYKYDGASASRPTLTLFNGYYNHDAGDTTLRINHSSSLFASGVGAYIGDIKSGDTVTFTKDASNYEVWTCSSDGTFTTDTDGGYWTFTASVVRTGTISTGDDVTLTTSAQHLRDTVDYINSNTGGRIALGYSEGDTIPNAALACKMPSEITGAFYFESPDGSYNFQAQLLNSGFASFKSNGTLSFSATVGLDFGVDGTNSVITYPRSNDDPVVYIGGVNIASPASNTNADIQCITGPGSSTSTNNAGHMVWNDSSTHIGRYSFGDPSDSSAIIAELRYDNSTDDLILENASGSGVDITLTGTEARVSTTTGTGKRAVQADPNGSLEAVEGWRDITSQVLVRGTGPTDPSWNQIGSGPFSGYQFSIGDKCWFAFHIPHDIVPNSDFHIHAHWIPDGTNTNTVKWQFTYTVARGFNQAAFNMATGTVITAEEAGPGTAYQHMVTETTGITDSEVSEPDGMIYVAAERITNGGTDNTDGIFLLTVDIHYRSTNLATLGKAPDFYT